MRRTAVALGFLAGFLSAAEGAWADAAPPGALAELTVDVEGVAPKGGILRMGLYNEARYPDDDSVPIASADVKAVPGETKVVLHNIVPGVYAIQLFQDYNANNKMDTSWVGLPLEPFGFSRDAHPFLSKPTFDEVKFTLVPGANIQVIHLQNTQEPSQQDKIRDQLRNQGLR